MPRKGPAYPINAEWKQIVLIELGKREISRVELSRRLHCSRSAITELFDDGSIQSTLVPGIHQILEWPPPRIAIPTKDSDEIAYLFANLSEVKAAQLLERARALFEAELEKQRKPSG